MHFPNSLTRAAVVVALVAAAPALHAQDITAEARAHRGKLVIGADQGTMLTIGAGGPARYRAHLAVASRVLDVLERDVGLAAPIGYDIHLWRIAGPNDPPLDRFFPSHSGIFGVLLYYYDEQLATGHQLEVSGEGPVFKVLVNDPSCAINLRDRSDADERGPMGTAMPRGKDYMGYPSYGEDGGCIAITTSARPLTIPVSQERWLRARIRHRRAVLDSSRADAQADSPEAWDSSAAAAYKQWLAEAPARDAQRKAKYDALRHPPIPGATGNLNPDSAIADLRRHFKESDSITAASLEQAMHHSENPELQAARKQVAGANTQLEQTIQALEATLAGMSPAERRAPAYIDPRSGTPSLLVDRHAPGAMAVVAPNPAFLDKSLSTSAPQVITVQVDCRKIDGQAVGAGCGGPDPQRMNDYERILAHLDWAALRALVAGAH